MKTNLLSFLFGESQVRDEIDESLGEDLQKLFEAADGADLTTRKSTLVDALKACGVSGEVKDDPEGFCLAFEDGDEYRAACDCLAEPETFHKLAELGWVVAKGGDRAMSGEPADYGIRFLEITTVVTGDSDKVPNAEKVRKDSRKDATAEQDRDDELNPVEDKDYTSDDNQKGMGDAKDGSDPEGKPKGSSKSESISSLTGRVHGSTGDSPLASPYRATPRGEDSEPTVECPECGGMAYINPRGRARHQHSSSYECTGCGHGWEDFGESAAVPGQNLADMLLGEGGHKAGCTCGFCKNKGKGFGKKKDAEAEGADGGVADKDTGHDAPKGGDAADTSGVGKQEDGDMPEGAEAIVANMLEDESLEEAKKRKAVKGKVVAKAPGKVVREDCGVAKCKKSPKAKPVAKAPGKVKHEGQGLARDPEYVKLANAVRFALKGHPSAQPLDAARKALAQYCAQRGINVRQDPELVELLYENDLPEPPRVDEMTTCGDIPSLESPMAFNGGPRTKPDAKERLRRLKMRRDPEGTEGQK